MNTLVRLALAVLLLAAMSCGGRGARAQPASGFYVGGGVGYGLLQNQSATIAAGTSTTSRQSIAFGGGVAAVGSIGYGVGNGLRLELEGDYRSNSHRGGGSETKYGGMGNLLLDLDLGIGWARPYVGAGAGYQTANWNGFGAPAQVGGSAGGLAYQAIVGAAFPVDAVPGLSLTLEYRYLALAGTHNYHGVSQDGMLQSRVRSSGDDNHAILLGLRYAFDVAGAGGPQVRPPLADAAGPALATRTYLIYFDGESADLTAHARDVVAEAIRASTRVLHTRIEIAGSGGAPGGAVPDQGLALRRAESVATEMERSGVPAGSIDVHTDTGNPTVSVAPPNQRVEIVYR